MEALIVIMVLFFALFVAAGVFATVKVVGATKRGVDRTITQARRTYEDTTLRARTYAQGGPAGELAELRLSLRTSMRSTQDALATASEEDASLEESRELFRRLSAHGHELDDELKQLERDPDRIRLGEHLPELRERTERITHAADSMRWAVRDRARKFADDDLASLSAQIEVESGALRHWATEGAGEPDSLDGLGDRPWPEPEATGAGAPAQTWPEGQPQAITGGQPKRTAHPWEKPAEDQAAAPVAAPRRRPGNTG